ncbi:hypothetical protein ACXYTP_21580 [Tsukamurella ocularis]
MSDHLSDTPAEHLVPVHEAAAILGGSPALYVALLRGGLIEGELRDGVWHVDAAVVGAALAVRSRTAFPPTGRRATCTDAALGHREGAVDGAA